MYVECGHCKACQQKKAAARARRIRADYHPDWCFISVTLTYDNWAVPYVNRSDIQDMCKDIPVYRDCQDWHARYGSSYDQVVKRHKETHELETFSVDYDYVLTKSDACLRDLTKRPGRIGVLYYKDVQDFNKRLKQNLLRKYNYEGEYRFFCAGEYGSKQRPHFHLLVPCKVQDFSIFRSAIRESWTYGDMRKEKRVEVARDMAGYLSSYVNRGARFPPFLSENFPPLTHFSHGFGTHSTEFSLPSILSKIDRGDLSYNIKSKRSASGFVSVLTPKYVINRYFPRFKGDFRLPCSALRDFLRNLSLQSLSQTSRFGEIDYDWQQGISLYKRALDLDDDEDKMIPSEDGNTVYRGRLQFYSEDYRRILVRQLHAVKYFMLNTGMNAIDYAIYWEKAWTTYRSNVLKMHHCADNAPPLNERYYNLNEVFEGGLKSYGFGDLGFDFEIVDPNSFHSVVEETQRLISAFDSYQKYKDINGEVLSTLDEEF